MSFQSQVITNCHHAAQRLKTARTLLSLVRAFRSHWCSSSRWLASELPYNHLPDCCVSHFLFSRSNLLFFSSSRKISCRSRIPYCAVLREFHGSLDANVKHDLARDWEQVAESSTVDPELKKRVNVWILGTIPSLVTELEHTGNSEPNSPVDCEEPRVVDPLTCV